MCDAAGHGSVPSPLAVPREGRAWVMSGESKSGLPLRPLSAVVLLLAVIATLTAAWTTRAAVRGQEQRLLKERTSELGLLLSNAIDAIPRTLAADGAILKATNGSPTAFQQAATADMATAPGQQLTLAWLRRDPTGGYAVLAAAGDALRVGSVVRDGPRVATLNAAARTPNVVATPVFGAERRLGFALAAPAAPAGTVLYRESVLGPLA